MTARAGAHTSARRRELRLQRAAQRSCIPALLLLARGEAPQSTSPPPFAALREQISPWANAAENAALLSASSRLRGVSGAQYRDFNAAFRDHVARLGIPYDYVETDCEHYYGCPLDREGQNSWLLVQSAFSQPASDGQP
jgi:hypothetical protein